MRCPNCAGEIPAGSRFCGICGRNITVAPLAEALGDAARVGRWPAAAARPDAAQPAMSLFELPVSRGARTAKLALVLVLDAILAGAGIVMILSYLDARSASGAPPERPAPARTGAVKVGAPKSVAPPSPTEAQAAGGPEKQGAGDRRRETGDDRGAETRQPKAAPLETAAPPRAGEAPVSAPVAAPAEVAAVDEVTQPADEEMDGLTARLTAAVARRAGDLERCYQRAAKGSGPSDPLEGTIDVHVTVMPDGSARDVRAGDNTTGSAQLADCAASIFRSLTVTGGAVAPVQLVWPLQFNPPET